MHSLDQETSLSTRINAIYADARNHSPSMQTDYVVKDWFYRRETSLVYGPSNVGKSAFAGMIGRAVVRGSGVLGARVQHGLVVHVAAEAPKSILDRTTAYEINKDAAVHPYLVRQAAVDFSDEAEVGMFLQELRHLGERHNADIALVIVDTLSRSIGIADENAAGEMTRVVTQLERVARDIHAHVMCVHHTGKDADRGGRGSSALRSAVDTEVRLAPQDEGSVRVSCDKQRNEAKPAPRAFRLDAVTLGEDQDGDPRTTVVALETEPSASEKQKQARGAQSDHYAVIRTVISLVATGRIPSFDRKFSACDLARLLPEHLLEGANEEARRKCVARVLGKLALDPTPIVAKEGNRWRVTC